MREKDADEVEEEEGDGERGEGDAGQEEQLKEKEQVYCTIGKDKNTQGRDEAKKSCSCEK